MAYQLPDIREAYNRDFGELKRLKSQLEFHLKVVTERLEGYILCECNICYNPQLSYDDIPEGWGWLKSMEGYLLCDKCIEKWHKKFNEYPNIYKRGDELEDNDLQDSDLRLLSNGDEIPRHEENTLHDSKS